MGLINNALEKANKRSDLTRGAANLSMPVPFRSISSKRAKMITSAECYQSLKANLLNRNPNQCIKTIIFSSTAHGDGSTTTAVNFARTLADDCRLKVLLVDTNFRTPCLHNLFQLENSFGLSDYLANGAKLDLPAVKGRLNKLFVLPCGSKRSGPISLFESITFDRFLQVAREQYDYVILDTPPVHIFAESQVICPKVDGAVLVIRAGKTRKQVAQHAKKEIETAGGRVLGVVINQRKFHIPDWLYERL